jgi:hypothetical protein
MLNSEDLNFSFSGLKTAVIKEISKIKNLDNNLICEFSYEIQEAITDVLVYKTLKAAQHYDVAYLILFSTSQLFNLIALDRLQGLLHQKNFLKSTAHIVDILKANSGGKIPLGAIIAEEAIAGTLPEVEINLEEYIETSGIKEPGLIFKLKSFVFAIINPNKKLQFKNFARQTKKN